MLPYRALGTQSQWVLKIVRLLAQRWRPEPKPKIPSRSPEPMDSTPPERLEEIVRHLHEHCSQWIEMPRHEKARLLRACVDPVIEIAEDAATAGTYAKGSEGWGIGEELMTFIPVVTGLQEYANSLERGILLKPPNARKRDNGQYVVDVWPSGIENFIYGGMKAEVWIQPGKEPTAGKIFANRQEEMREEIRNGEDHGIGIVLGAGNQIPVVILDILHVLIVENRTVCCKMHPVNEYLGPYFRRALLPLVERGFVEFVYGDVNIGKELCNHHLSSLVHLTGSPATYDAIVWQGQPKAGVPPFQKQVSAELGCITPYIIVPGEWSAQDLQYHAKTVAAGLTLNAGHNCLAAEIIVTDNNWPQRKLFLDALRNELKCIPNRVAYYPGSSKKAAKFKFKFPDAEEIGCKAVLVNGGLIASEASFPADDYDPRRLPWMLKTGLKPEEASTKEENWCGVLQEVSLRDCNGDPVKFFESAVAFANESLWGTLSCSVIIHPKTMQQYSNEFEEAIAQLRYGTIAINLPTSIGYGITSLPWGAFPGSSTIYNIGTGNVQVQNTNLFDFPEKGVVQGPWEFYPYPVWFTDHACLEETVRKLLRWHAHPNMIGILPILPAALRG